MHVQSAVARLLAAAAVGALMCGVSNAQDNVSCAQVPYEAAIPFCTRAIESGRYAGEDLSGLYNNRGIRYDVLKDRDRALADFTAAVKINPANFKAYNNRAGVYHTHFNDSEKALADYDRALKIDPTYGISYLGRGSVYRTIGNYQRALEDYTKAISLNQNYALAYYNRGLTYLHLKELEKALADQSAAIKFAPKAWQPLAGRGAVHLAGEKFDLAIADFNAALQINAKAAEPLYGRGLAKLKKGDTAGGNEDIAAAKALNAAVAEVWFVLTKIQPDDTKSEPEKRPQVAVAPAPPANTPSVVAHAESCTTDGWGFLAFHGFEFGTLNTCQEAVTVWFMRGNSEVKTGTVKSRGVFTTEYDVDRYRDKIIPWFSATCPAGYEPSPRFSYQNRKAFDDSTYKCVATR